MHTKLSIQDLILNDTCKLIAVAVARQSGKSTMAVLKALHYVLNHDNATVLVISKTLNQSKELIAKLKSLINNSPLKDDLNQLADGYDNKSEFYVKNKGKDTYSSYPDHTRTKQIKVTEVLFSYCGNIHHII